jgi:hypothetical protein
MMAGGYDVCYWVKRAWREEEKVVRGKRGGLGVWA